MKLLLWISFLVFSSSAIFAQTPGNVGTTNLTAWFKPDALPNGNVTTWSTTFPTGAQQISVTDVSTPFPQATNTPAGNVSNYNKTLFFNNNTSTNLQALTNSNTSNLLENNTTGAQGTFFCAYYFPSGNPINNNHMMLYNDYPHGIQFRNLGANGRLAIGRATSNSTNACRNWAENFEPSIISYKGNRNNATSFKAFENDLLFTTNSASQSSGPDGLYIGTYPASANAPYNGYLHEFIFFDTDLTDIEMRKVHSYLAIKYGITLDNVGGGAQGDYLASNSDTIWDASASPNYHNNVIGIGRDDDQSLLQKQSHSFTDNYRLYIDQLQTSNDDNLGNFNSNFSFLTMGQTTDASCGNVASNLESPSNVTSRIEKEWKITNTNFDQTFNWDVQIDTCTIPGYAVGNVDISALRFLVDTDGDFTNAMAYDTSSNINMVYANGYVTVSGISNVQLPEDSTRYFTIGYETISVSLAGNDSICQGDSVTITVNIQNAIGPLDIPISNGTSIDTLFSITDGFTYNVGPNSTTTYSTIGYSSFMDCCGSGSNNFLTVNVTPYPTVTPNISPTSICLGDSIQLDALGTTTYLWNGSIANGTYQTPLTTTTYTVIGTDAPGCSDTAFVNITVNSNPVVSATTSNAVICANTPVTVNGSGATTYTWSNGVTNNVAFTPSSTHTYLVTGTDANGCSDTASVTITVNNLPNVSALATDSTLCEGQSTSVYGGGAVSYLWNNGVTNNTIFTPSASAFYVVTGTDANNCQNVDSVYVLVNPRPVVQATASPNPLCAGDTTQLLATGANTYAWSSGTPNGDSVILFTTTNFTVIGSTLAGCLDTATITVNVNPNPIVSANSPETVVCEGQSTSLFGQGAINYIWSDGIVDNQVFTPITTTLYTVIGIDANGCGAVDTITINVVPNPTFDLGADTVTCPEEPVAIFGPFGYSTYLWSTNQTTQAISTNSAGLIALTVTDANGCTAYDDLFIGLADSCRSTFIVPNVFTPNGDYANDYFFIEATNMVEQTITIFNRWGNVIYDETSVLPVWNGKNANGEFVTDGVYFVKYSLKGLNGDVFNGTSFFQVTGTK